MLGDTDGRAAVEEVLQEQKLRARGCCSTTTGTWSSPCAMRSSTRHELIGTEITDVLEQAQREHGARHTRSIGSGTTSNITSGTTTAPVIDLRDAVLPTQATGSQDAQEPRVEPAG